MTQHINPSSFEPMAVGFSESDIRALLLQPEIKLTIKRLMLTENHIDTLRFISNKGVTSSQLSQHQGTLV